MSIQRGPPPIMGRGIFLVRFNALEHLWPRWAINTLDFETRAEGSVGRWDVEKLGQGRGLKESKDTMDSIRINPSVGTANSSSFTMDH